MLGRRLVPDRVREAALELRAVIAAAVCHNASVVADSVVKGVKGNKDSLIRSIFLAELDCAPGTFDSHIAVTRPETVLALIIGGRPRRRRITYLRLELKDAGQVVINLVRPANTEIRQVTGKLAEPAVVGTSDNVGRLR